MPSIERLTRIGWGHIEVPFQEAERMADIFIGPVFIGVVTTFWEHCQFPFR